MKNISCAVGDLIVAANTTELSTFAHRTTEQSRLWYKGISLGSDHASMQMKIAMMFIYSLYKNLTIKQAPPNKVSKSIIADIKPEVQMPFPALPVLAHATGKIQPITHALSLVNLLSNTLIQKRTQ
eukprot:TRINITY_DN64610_c2_g1_i1.p7 TRINITY_DN64610_c2_g1~~TRINITY_DN64610_c2_g1_i1.p7  ORF type:complete len:126 (-),score=1.87 TRINITY_DN64610_c2_g1_i1:427-804(-)